MENKVRKPKVTAVILLALISVLPIVIYLLSPNSPFTCVFVSVYTVAAFVTAYLSTMKKGNLITNPLNLPAVGALVACVPHLLYADFCLTKFWVLGIFMFYGLWAVMTIGVNILNRGKGMSNLYHKLIILLAFFFAMGCCTFLINTAFDKSEPVTVEAEIIKRRTTQSGRNSRFLVSSDETPYGASLNSLIVSVSEQAYEDFEEGDTVPVSVKKGALGIHYCRFVEDGYTGESVWEAKL